MIRATPLPTPTPPRGKSRARHRGVLSLFLFVGVYAPGWASYDPPTRGGKKKKRCESPIEWMGVFFLLPFHPKKGQGYTPPLLPPISLRRQLGGRPRGQTRIGRKQKEHGPLICRTMHDWQLFSLLPGISLRLSSFCSVVVVMYGEYGEYGRSRQPVIVISASFDPV